MVPVSTVLAQPRAYTYTTPLAAAGDLFAQAAESAGVVKLVDTLDSKSNASDSVPVQVRPPVPYAKSPAGDSRAFLFLSPMRAQSTTVAIHHLFQHGRKCFVHLVPIKAPAPVFFRRTGRIHSMLAIER